MWNKNRVKQLVNLFFLLLFIKLSEKTTAISSSLAEQYCLQLQHCSKARWQKVPVQGKESPHAKCAFPLLLGPVWVHRLKHSLDSFTSDSDYGYRESNINFYYIPKCWFIQTIKWLRMICKQVTSHQEMQPFPKAALCWLKSRNSFNLSGSSAAVTPIQ